MEWMWAAMGAMVGGDPFTINTSGYSKPFAGSTGSNDFGDYAWYGYSSGGSATALTTTVAGSKLPNELGLYDMSGNVYDWCLDWDGNYPTGFQADYWEATPGTYRVRRGGDWNNNAYYCTIAWRTVASPHICDGYNGFRVVRK